MRFSDERNASATRGMSRNAKYFLSCRPCPIRHARKHTRPLIRAHARKSRRPSYAWHVAPKNTENAFDRTSARTQHAPLAPCNLQRLRDTPAAALRRWSQPSDLRSVAIRSLTTRCDSSSTPYRRCDLTRYRPLIYSYRTGDRSPMHAGLTFLRRQPHTPTHCDCRGREFSLHTICTSRAQKSR